jgi:tRNA(Ile)-lysidine synthase TilS/MesJ
MQDLAPERPWPRSVRAPERPAPERLRSVLLAPERPWPRNVLLLRAHLHRLPIIQQRCNALSVGQRRRHGNALR